MKTPKGNINLITDATFVHQKTMDNINKAVREGNVFALGYQEGKEKGAMIFNPANLTAVHTDGVTLIRYNCFENFADAIRLTLIAYPVFIDCSKIIEDNKPKIILLP